MIWQPERWVEGSLRCNRCRIFGFCAVNCTIAPWNFDKEMPRDQSLVYLMRFRRWKGSYLTMEDVRWVQ